MHILKYFFLFLPICWIQKCIVTPIYNSFIHFVPKISPNKVPVAQDTFIDVFEYNLTMISYQSF